MKAQPQTTFYLNSINFIPPYQILFNNPSKHDSTLTKHIELNDITEFFYGIDDTVINKQLSIRFKYLLVFPGDSICLNNKTNAVIYSSNGSGYIDNIIYIPDYASLIANDNRSDNPYLKGLKNLVSVAQEIFDKNEKKIQMQTLSDAVKAALHNINLIEKYYQIYSLINVENLSEYELNALDSVNRAVINDSAIFNISSPNLYIIIENMIKISAKNNGEKLDNFWNYFSKASDGIKQMGFYKYYAYFKIASAFFDDFDGKNANADNPSLQKAQNTLSTIQNRSALEDSLLRFTDILLETKTNYAKAKQDLNNYDKGKYAFIFSNDALANHEKKTIANLSNVKLLDFKGSEHDFRNVVTDKKYKLIVVDFWANWCAPCLKETPYYIKAKEKLKNQSIKFVGVSIDDAQDEGKWIAVAKKQDLYNDPLQYRMVDYNNSQLTALLQINTIPRYIVFDNDGNVVDEDLERPSSGKFESTLLKYLQ